MKKQLSPLNRNRRILLNYALGGALAWTLVIFALGLIIWQDHLFKIIGSFFLLWLTGLAAVFLSFSHFKKQLLKSEEGVSEITELRNRYENILSAAGEGILGLDRDYLHVFVNPAAEKMLGYTQAELLGVPSHQSWHAYEAEASPYSLNECPVCQAMHDGKSVKKFRDQFARKDGTLFPVEISISPIVEKGVVQGAVVVFQDISDKIENETRMKKLSSIIEQTHGAVAIVKLDGTIEYVNHGYEVISGYTVAEMLGRHPRDLFFTDEKRAAREELWQALREGRRWRGILASRQKNGAIVYEDTTGFPISDDQGKIINYAVIKYDVTQSQKLQEQLFQAQKMEAVGTLASGVAHDFNNLLTVINSISEVLADECGKDSPMRSDLLEINEAGRRAADLTRQLLAFSRREMIQPEEVCLRRLIKNLMKMMQRLLGEDVALNLDLPGPETTVSVKADPGQFEQVVVNLLVNARDALRQTDELGAVKQIRLRLSEVVLDEDFIAIHEGSQPGRQALIEISDNGCGMSLEALEHCFEPFFTTKELGQGTGLGLSTVYGIVKQNSGYINIYSEPGQGTSIQIYWPLCKEGGADAKAESKVSAIEDSRKDLTHFKGATILLAEDDERIRQIAHDRLAKAGFVVIAAADGQEALDKMGSAGKVPDLLFTDMVMPGLSGSELSRKLRKRYPDLPVLYCSGYTDNSVIVELGEREAFLQKPYTINALLAVIVELLNV